MRHRARFPLPVLCALPMGFHSGNEFLKRLHVHLYELSDKYRSPTTKFDH